jgi:thioredoxin reductase
MKQDNPSSTNAVELAIIGAGPYGLSIAAHLGARGIQFRIFGDPMSAWSKKMPKGMHLKSEGFASSLSDPDSAFTLRNFCEERGLPYADTGLPVPLETFVAYGLEFQKRFAPALERKTVISIRQAASGFELQLDDGETFFARRVIMAAGIVPYAHIPVPLSALPRGFVSHSSEHSDLEKFRGQHVIVVGGGASALDLAALLHEAGANVEVVARTSVIRFHDPPRPRSLKERIVRPTTGLGAGMQLLFYVKAPRVFRLLPRKIKIDRLRKTLGPAPGWFVRDRVVGKIPLRLGVEISSAVMEENRVSLHLTDGQNGNQTVVADHVIAATGYRVDLERLQFLDPALRGRILTTERAPALSDAFESSVPGLYFIGVSAASTFGPLMRFAYGSDFTARHLSSHLGRLLGPSFAKSRKNGHSPDFPTKLTPSYGEIQMPERLRNSDARKTSESAPACIGRSTHPTDGH